ncbi:MAG: TetR family transcriptional regulator [Halieaceae bacterium]|jgi:AcrR family transcriptional regulator|nr:TetR family transcriptional regulator [Halieaceae bacterium]
MAVRAALNRGAYVEAALEVIADVGVDKLSMRNVATRLNVSPMAMYKHFPTKDDLLAASLEEFIARARVIPDAALPWEQWVEHAAGGMYEALCRELSWVPLLGSLRVGEQAIAVTEAFVRRLCEAGFTVEQALQAYFAVIQVVVGAVCLRASLDARPDTGAQDHGRQGARAIQGELRSFLKRDQIAIGLPLIINALRAQLKEASV